MLIRYSQCWEDPTLVIESLKLNNEDVVLSIASGGENIFAILLKNPKKVIAIDSNLDQLYLVKLKTAAITALDFEEFVEFMGFKDSTSRIKYFERCKKHLKSEEINFWEDNLDSIKKGIVHIGKFENYLLKFRKYILSLVLSKNKIKKFLSASTLEEQEYFFKNYWNGIRWKLLFRIFFSKFLMSKLGRDKDYFKYNSNKNIAKHYFDRTKYGITKVHISKNYFMEYILTGNIKFPFKEHPYLDKNNFSVLKDKLKQVEYIKSDVLNFLKKIKPNSISKYNLSDIFEIMSQKEYSDIFKEITRTSKKDARVCYWNNLVERKNRMGEDKFSKDSELSDNLSSKDRVFFYSRFIVEKRN